MKLVNRGLAMAALVALAAPAGAVPFTYTFNGTLQATGGTTVTTSGNTVTQVGGTINGADSTTAGAPSVHISAYSKSGNGSSAGTVTTAKLGNYDTGLGVTNRTEDGSSPSHTIDNNNGTDFIVLQFSTAVNLSGAMLNAFSDPGGSDTSGNRDADVTLGYLNTTFNSTAGADPFANNSTFTALGITTLGTFMSSTDPTNFNFNTVSPTDTGIYANTWIIMADMLRTGTSGYDDFKVTNFTVTTPGGVPEPATWAMMIGGFGMIGASLRRRNRKALLAA